VEVVPVVVCDIYESSFFAASSILSVVVQLH